MSVPMSSVEWQADHEACECTLCQSKFTILRRRHHCRTCGCVVCNSCSTNRMKKPSVTGTSRPVRVCDRCWDYHAPSHLRRPPSVSPRPKRSRTGAASALSAEPASTERSWLRSDADPPDYSKWNRTVDLQHALEESRQIRREKRRWLRTRERDRGRADGCCSCCSCLLVTWVGKLLCCCGVCCCRCREKLDNGSVNTNVDLSEGGTTLSGSMVSDAMSDAPSDPEDELVSLV